MSDNPVVPLIIRGQIFTDNLVPMGGRGGDLTFLTPDVNQYLDRLPLYDPCALDNLDSISYEEILDYFVSLGQRLDIKTNRHMQQAYELSCHTAPATPAVLAGSYASIPDYFQRDYMRDMVEPCVDVAQLAGLVDSGPRASGRRVRLRGYGVRALHIIGGNSPEGVGITLLRSAFTRCDSIIKTPSNDPFTAVAIVRSMIDMAPDHPITRHLSVAYWKGGDANFERAIYHPDHLRKVFAWGGHSSVEHIEKYIKGGDIELVLFGPKRSISLIGPQVFEDDALLQEAARRAAFDIGWQNQTTCVNSRITYVQSGTDSAGVERANRIAAAIYEALLALPESVSTRARHTSRDLQSWLQPLFLDDAYRIFGCRDNEGGIIASQYPEPVDFGDQLTDRIANVVPIDSIADMLQWVNHKTKAAGVFPEAYKEEVRNRLFRYGVQQMFSLGFVNNGTVGGPQDNMEVLRRMVDWKMDEDCSSLPFNGFSPPR